MKEVTCANLKCKFPLVVSFQMKVGGIGSKPAWDTITCPKCGETFDIDPVPGTITNVSAKE